MSEEFWASVDEKNEVAAAAKAERLRAERESAMHDRLGDLIVFVCCRNRHAAADAVCAEGACGVLAATLG